MSACHLCEMGGHLYIYEESYWAFSFCCDNFSRYSLGESPKFLFTYLPKNDKVAKLSSLAISLMLLSGDFSRHTISFMT